MVRGSYDGTAMVWDVECGETILKIKTWQDSTMIATGGDHQKNDVIKIWTPMQEISQLASFEGQCMENVVPNH